MPSGTPEQLRDPAINVQFGTEFLGKLLGRYNGDVQRALIAFNAGHTVADSFNGDVSTLNAETQDYLKKVAKRLGVKNFEDSSTIAGVQEPAPGAAPLPTASALPVRQLPASERVPVPAPRARAPAPLRAPVPIPKPSTPVSSPPAVRRENSVPVVWQQAVAKFLQSRDPKDLSGVPEGSLAVIMLLMGQSARGRP